MKKPLLIDLDGVLRLGKTPAPGIQQFLDFLEASKTPACVISNSTLANAEMIKNFFAENGIDFNLPMMTSADATLQYVKSKYDSVAVYCSEPVRSMFKDQMNYENPDAVVVGDMGKDWSFDVVNSIFKLAHAGADLIAMQKNRFWKTPEDGLLIDAGAFITGIEYATQEKAILIGKPSPIYFISGLKMLGLSDDQKFIMLGDDLETDITGANNLGAESILIYTGKTSHPLSSDSKVRPTYEASNLLTVVELLEEFNK
jgi:HAD superfamily hydrolase (TIGR01458 family)